jgi:hypothetical protein
MPCPSECKVNTKIKAARLGISRRPLRMKRRRERRAAWRIRCVRRGGVEGCANCGDRTQFKSFVIRAIACLYWRFEAKIGCARRQLFLARKIAAMRSDHADMSN